MDSSPFIPSLRLSLYVSALAVTLFMTSGDISWVMAWVLTAILFATVAFNVFFLMRKSPDLIEERMHPRAGAKGWDFFFSTFVGSLGPLSLFIVAGADHRFGWTLPFSAPVMIGATLVQASGHVLTLWSMSVNRFFSAVVRIQHDRGHMVVSSGPYRFVRHPGYAGAILTFLATPLMLSSLWAFIPSLATIIMIVTRTLFEDSTLIRELGGYREYAKRVRFRVLPGIW